MHPAVTKFCSEIRDANPSYFTKSRVLDCGSLDINGNNRYLFTDCDYTGIDVGPGRNVDAVSLIHEWNPDGSYQTIISTECFEHDMHLRESIANIVRLLEQGGLFMFTCATTGRNEHGTNRKNKSDAPLLSGEAGDYYRNVTEDMIADLLEGFTEKEFRTVGTDLQFWGIK